MALLVSGCATGSGKITNAEICFEIPFADGPEGVCYETVTRKQELFTNDEWAKRRPYMLMIHVDSWTEIKKDWLAACRVAGPKCNVTLNSVDKIIMDIDKVLKTIKKE